MPVPRPEQERFRAEVCKLLREDQVREEVAQSRRVPYGQEAGLLDVHRRLGKLGWLAVNWPERYGGSGGTFVEKAILTEEMIRHGVPENVHSLGIDIVGSAINFFGTDEQKERFLPGLARGETTANVLFSEPGVGSDLASLTTRAEPDGEGWRLHGKKIYNMKAQHSDFALCAARTSTGPVNYFGITLFLVPLQSMGVVIEPLWNMSEERFDCVTLDGIRVGPEDVLGDVDDGWQVLNKVLPLERTGLDHSAKAERTLAALQEHAPAGSEERLVELETRVRAARLLAWRCVNNLQEGNPDEVDSATAKWYTSETAKEVSIAAVELIGSQALLDARDPDAIADGIFDAALREAPGLTLAQGSSEIMLFFVATSKLGLPS
ncbi:acyl-CoA dehydrogenase family protein [Kibdelosporangium philippinense]|uniref:Acyl-CoA dehydrogenase family protein n=1 Tax=Kibdelosporangium philippinense TaxID=211113 RepID=A0ABS8Z6H8_9PSEU|nr:acyl-CoA dehydrogenase family protein [Kibdelosporangium philippinense]MCE7003037.1 acyl-CoA dehydrogenase family protein [Kibdelosporangium philippinense]